MAIDGGDSEFENLDLPVSYTGQSVNSAPLVAVHPHGSRQPFLFVDMDDRTAYHRRLAGLLGPDQPFYALQSHERPGGQDVQHIEVAARNNLQVLRTVQPEGPYLVGGRCDGGLVAFEMAQQVRTEGHAVELQTGARSDSLNEVESVQLDLYPWCHRKNIHVTYCLSRLVQTAVKGRPRSMQSDRGFSVNPITDQIYSLGAHEESVVGPPILTLGAVTHRTQHRSWHEEQEGKEWSLCPCRVHPKWWK